MTKKKLFAFVLVSLAAVFSVLTFLPRERTPEPELDNRMSLFCEGLLCVRKGREHGYVNENGQVVIPLQFESAEPFRENGVAQVRTENERKFINPKGKSVDLPEKTPEQEKEDVSWYWENGLHGLQDKDGNPISEAIFADYGPFAENGLARVYIRSGGYVDKTGSIVIPLQFSAVRDFASNGLAAVCYGGKWGYIDATGEYVIEPQFEDAHAFTSSGLAAVKVESESGWGFINEKGEFVIDPELEWCCSGFGSDGLALVRKDDRYCFINRRGKVVHELLEGTEFVDFGYNDGTLGKGYIYSRGTSYIFDRKGNILIQPDQYDELSYRYDSDMFHGPC